MSTRLLFAAHGQTATVIEKTFVFVKAMTEELYA